MEFLKVIEIRNRMCERMLCDDCPINNINEAKGKAELRYTCWAIICNFPAEVEKALIEWDKANPVKTLLSDFLEKHPKTGLDDDGTPHVCPCDLGYTTGNDCVIDKNGDLDCLACWSRPLESEGTE